MKNKSKIVAALLFAANLAFISCDDWTDVESIDIKQPNIEEQNPELYTKYLENLRQYKEDSEHMKVYAWFDNSEKTPYSRAQHMKELPDSIDIVALMHPDGLVAFEKEEMSLLQKKGTKVIYTISYEDIKAQYDELVSVEEPEGNVVVFNEYLKSEMEKRLAYSSVFNGIILKLIGQNPKYITEEDKLAYAESLDIVFSEILTWKEQNNDKILVFQGKPQNIIDKSVLNNFSNIIIELYDVANREQISFPVLESLETGVPTDRFIMAVSTPSLDSSDKTTGYIGTEEAIIETAYWITEISNEYTKAGIAINNVQNDYYLTNGTYRNVRETINIMNPAPVK